VKTTHLKSKKELSSAIGVSTRAIDHLVAAGKIPSVRLGTRRLFDIAEVIAVLKTGVASPENGGLGPEKEKTDEQ